MALQTSISQRENGDEAWPVTANRFVAFFDILGFKEMVLKSTHLEVLRNLSLFQRTVSKFGSISEENYMKKNGVTGDQVHAVTFSDSLILFSKGDEPRDLLKIIFDAYGVLVLSQKLTLPIKGALSYGKITVDKEGSLFFGQPIIDAYLLHEDLHMLTAILDEKIQVKIREMNTDSFIDSLLTSYRANLKSGRVTHIVLRPKDKIDAWLESVTKMYDLTSGKSRIYIDNTVDFLTSLKSSGER
jgi:hypothetical protein